MKLADHSPVTHTPATQDATGPTVLFVHGFAADGDSDWPADRWTRRLALAGRASLVPDLPAHGCGPDPRDADEARTGRLLDYLGEVAGMAKTDAIDVVGYSLGARLAWDFASSSPVPVRRLVLGGLSPVEPFGAVDCGAIRALIADGTVPTDPMTAGIGAMIAGTGARALALTALVEGLGREPFDPTAQPPSVPTLLVRGADDGMTEGMTSLADQLPDAHTLTVPGDHVGALHSDEFRHAAFDFLDVPHA